MWIFEKNAIYFLRLNLIETHFNTFANRAEPYQAALTRAARLGSTLFAYGNITQNDVLKCNALDAT